MSDNDFNWLNEPDPEADDQGAAAGEVPDWLDELKPTGASEDQPQADSSDAPVGLSSSNHSGLLRRLLPNRRFPVYCGSGGY